MGMNRRNFLKMMGAASVLVPINTLGIPVRGMPDHDNLNQSALPRVRMILVGEASLEYLDGLVHPHAVDSPIRNWSPQDIVYLNADGELEVCPSQINRTRTSRVADGGEVCEQALRDLSQMATLFNKVEAEVMQFIQGCDWLLIVVALDSPIAFVSGERIASLARKVGVLSVAVVGTPYLDGHVEADASWNRSEALSVASQDVVRRLEVICHCTIPDNGMWGYGDAPWHWGFIWAADAVKLVSDVATRIDCCAQIGDSLATSQGCLFGSDYHGFELPKAAIEEAISDIASVYWLGNERSLVSSGAIIQVIGGKSRIEQIKQDVTLALQEPSKILRNGKPFWSDDASFQIITSSPDYMGEEEFGFIQVLSMGVVEI